MSNTLTEIEKKEKTRKYMREYMKKRYNNNREETIAQMKTKRIQPEKMEQQNITQEQVSMCGKFLADFITFKKTAEFLKEKKPELICEMLNILNKD